jgi:hypothetical protein
LSYGSAFSASDVCFVVGVADGVSVGVSSALRRAGLRRGGMPNFELCDMLGVERPHHQLPPELCAYA